MSVIPPSCLTLAEYLHRIDPFAIQITESFGIRWYGLAYVAGFACAYGIILWMARRGRTPLSAERVADFVLAVAIGTIVGGRLGYCVFYKPDMLIEFSDEFPFWGVLALNRGGMASHGGMIGIVLACLYYAHKHKLSPMHLFDLTTLGGTAGIFFGRIANFVNGELVGRPMATPRPWGCRFPQEIIDWSDEQRKALRPVAEELRSPLADWGGTPGSRELQEIVEATWQHDPQGDKIARMLEPLLPLRHPSQLYAAFLEGVLLFVLLMLIWRKPRKPGVIGAWFLVLYAVVRVVNEFFRMPDAHLGYQIFDLTRGQILSFGLFAVGLGLLVWWARRDAPRLGGWGGGVNHCETSHDHSADA